MKLFDFEAYFKLTAILNLLMRNVRLCTLFKLSLQENWARKSSINFEIRPEIREKSFQMWQKNVLVGNAEIKTVWTKVRNQENIQKFP